MIRRVILTLCIPVLLILSACSLPNRIEEPDAAIAEEVLEEIDVDCPPTAAPIIPVCPTPIVIETPEAPLRTAFVSSGNLALRAGPSVAHPALGRFPMGAKVKILGKAPGESWVAVSVPGGQLGWMYAQYLGIELSDPLEQVAEIEPAQSKMIEGRVVDDSDKPIGNIGVSVALGGLVDYPDFSDADGRFVVFVPDSQTGPWEVSIQGVGCLSRLVDEDCQLVNHVLRNPRQIYDWGQSNPLLFVYEATTMRLRGQVRDAAGSTYEGAGVFATRSDGAYVTGRSNESGFFDIPITPGAWSLIATRGQAIEVVVPESGYEGELSLVGSPN